MLQVSLGSTSRSQPSNVTWIRAKLSLLTYCRICKDSSKRFCPSCGNATLLRTSITTNAKTGAQTIHLKKNFQYHLRGTKYSIPDPKPGSAKGQQKGGSGLILREDQREWSDAVRSNDIKREKEERKAAKGTLQGWNDPDVSEKSRPVPYSKSARCQPVTITRASISFS